jgi:hypothetical protein
MQQEVPLAHLVHFAVKFHFVGLHHFLDGLPNITQPHINACCLDAGVGGLPHGLKQRVVAGVERNRKC